MDAKVNEWRPGPNVCRCCLTEGCYKDISTEYFWMGKREVYAEMLSETFDVTIAYSKSGGPNSNSRLICENCIARLRDATDFKRQVKECEKTFIQHLDPGNNVSADIESVRLEPQDDKTVKLESVKLEKRHSDDDFDDRNDFATTLDDDDDDLDDQPLLKLASKTPKKETENVDILDLLDNAKVTEKRKSNTRSKEPPMKKLKKKEPLPKPSASKNLTTEKKKKALGSSNRYAASRENAEIILRNTSVYPFRLKVNDIVCVYCCDTFEDPTVFRSHMSDEHATFNVATAFANLSKSEYVKVDVLNLRCRMCNVRTDTLVALAGHLHRDHCAKLQMDAQLGVQEFLLERNRWHCAICAKKVPSLYHLNRHTGTHYLNYICDSCGRSYITESGLAAHIKNTHGQFSKYSCRRCKKQFSSMEVKKHHLRTENYCQPFGCHMCSQRFLYWELRQKHLEMVHGKPKKIFSCADCGATFECRRLFHIHYKTLHTQDCYRCQCGQRFASKSAYEYHNVSHTGEKKFHCTVCGKMFSRKKNLNQHARIHEKDKRFACSACSHTFVQKRSLKSHMKVHHSDIITDFV